MRFFKTQIARFLTLIAVIGGSIGFANAAEPKPWQVNFQDAATSVMEQITAFDNFLLVVMTIICVFVLLLMAYVMIKFNAKANPEPSKTSHNTLIEVIWTVVPVLILVMLAVPSFRLLYFQEVIPETELTVKAVGYQWYWGYEYPDHGALAYDSIMLEDDELGEGQPRLLATDTAMVVPVNTNVKVQVTAADVLHAWTIPAFGVKVDAVPGKLNELWFNASKTGTYYGQCSELCGVRHAFMPIRVEVVSKEEFKNWVARAQAADEYIPIRAAE